MKMRTIALAAMIGCTLGVGIASAQREAREQNSQQNSAASIHAFVGKWQQRILNENLSVADPQNWAARSLPKLTSFSAERLALAMQAGSLGELEALMVSAPLANGASLALLAATKPGNISLDAMPARAVLKTDPATSPALYADLLFTALNPCRVYDSRPTSGGSGIWVNGAPRNVQIGPYGSYSFQGGSATSCGMTALAANAQIAAVMIAVSSFSQTAGGYLTFYSPDTPDPSNTVVSMFYQPGFVQTAFVVAPTDLFVDVFTRGVSKSANTHVTIDIVGYFAKPHALALDCVQTAVISPTIGAGVVNFFQNPACPAGYTATIPYCYSGVAGVQSQGSGVTGPTVGNPTYCAWHNTTGATQTVFGSQTCCRVPGR